MNGAANRSGYSLIELMVVFSISSTLMVISIGWIRYSMTFGKIVQHRQSDHQTLMRLGAIFRDDANHGLSAKMTKKAELQIESLDGTRIVYVTGERFVSRHVMKNESVKAQDHFRFLDALSVQIDADEVQQTVDLVVTKHVPTMLTSDSKGRSSDTSTPICLLIKASINRWNLSRGEMP